MRPLLCQNTVSAIADIALPYLLTDDFNLARNFNRDIKGQGRHAHCRSGLTANFGAKNVDDHIVKAVDDLGLTIEIRRVPG